MEVIGAGWGRTGTDSTKVALEKLGYKCQHAKVLMKCPTSVKSFWAQALHDKYGANALQPREWDKKAATLAWNEQGFSGGFDACVDFPFAPFYKEMLEANPDAKVLLTIRDNGHKWYRSTYDTIYAIYRNSGLLLWILQIISGNPMVGSLGALWNGVLQGTMEDEDKAVALYDKYIEEVKMNVPASQLLVFNAKEGWAPLCKFLGKPIPDEPFPHVNSSAEMKHMVGLLSMAETVTRVIAFLLLGFAVHYFLHANHKCHH